MSAADEFLSSKLQFLRGVGPHRAAQLAKSHLETVDDLLHRLPFRYEDRAHFAPIASLKVGQEPQAILCEVVDAAVKYTRTLKIFEATVRDGSARMKVTWPGQVYLQRHVRKGVRLVLYGKLGFGPGGVQMASPEFEVCAEEDEHDSAKIHRDRIVPIYRACGDVKTRKQRELVYQALSRMPETIEESLPASVARRQELPAEREALFEAHFPPHDVSLHLLKTFRTPAQKRLIFEEFFLHQLGLLLRRQKADAEAKPFRVVTNEAIHNSALDVLRRAALPGHDPFRLTNGQWDALDEVVKDMKKPAAMNRLLQGDVGAGKTIVALLAAWVAMENGLQVAFMAPTEILAEQHFNNMTRLLAGSRFRVELLTGGVPPATRRTLLGEIASGAISLVVGTHALVQERVTFNRLGLVVIDEQHRFGVVQRATLREKALNPDVLVMTATPIPRTLALTVHGDLDVSSIKELPPGRRPITTEKRAESRRTETYRFLRAQVEAGRQAYVVYPLVEESAKVDLKAATEMADHLAHDVFPHFRVALLHGRMKQDGKDRVMRAFAAGEIHILVSTTVIEVGIDVPNATVMIVEHAERFGLAQLHQLRGRVGRGAHQSWCLLHYEQPLSEEANRRLDALVDTYDGFVIAERDLELRGPGDFFGTRQSGDATFRVGDPMRDHVLMEKARAEAERYVQGGGDPAFIEKLRASWKRRFGLSEVG